jgi:DNA-directed RNA polymerase subunit RPC12/RpoP
MKAGEKTVCPACGQEILVQEKNLMDGWVAVGKVLICPMCEAHLSRQSETSLDADIEEETNNTSPLTDLLGEDDSIAVQPLDIEDDEGRFCRDCSYIIVHPFMSRCTLHECEVNPMSDCGDFVRRKQDEEE